jgi:hypothetical protein
MAEAALPVLLGGAASALGTYFGAQTSANAARQSAALQQQRFNQAASYQQPYIESGQNALNQYYNATGVNGAPAQQAYYDSFQNNPGFQSSVNYGLQQLQASNAAKGMGLSGNTLAALQDYSQHALSQEYQARLEDLLKGAQLGANSANALTSAATSSAATQGNYNLQSGQYLGTGIANTLNALSGAATNYATYYYGS